ncbi:MAG: hypothetical protein ACSHWU_05580 [Marinicella sp.]
MKPNNIICLCIALLLSQLAHCEVPQIEREALVLLYQQTDGENWTDNSNWLQDDPCDNSWFGIFCVDGEITFIELIDNNLTGNIPAEIGNFGQLKELSFNTNNLQGSIPNEIGNLTTLTRLSFGVNNLTGEIPESISNLTSLFGLYLQSNQLTGHIPESIGNLTNLRSLYFYSNQLSGQLPESIGNLTELIVLAINQNKLSGDIPASITNLQELVFFLFEYNALRSPSAEVSSFLFISSCFDEGFFISCEMDSQTLPPANFQVSETGQKTTLSWDAINYQQNGGYQVWMSDDDSGLYSLVFHTDDKTTTQHVLEGLPENAQRTFQLKSYTKPHIDNPNFVVSQAIDPDGLMTAGIQFPMQSKHSGSWYNASQDGHGVVVQILPGNIGLIYWYVYDNEGNQMWLVGTGPYDGQSIQANMNVSTGGMFPPEFESSDVESEFWGTVNLSYTGDGSMNFSWVPNGNNGFEAGQLDMQQITRMISQSSNQPSAQRLSDQITTSHSGAYFNPSQSGHGLAVEILPNGVGVIYWYVFDDAGNQVWLVGSGEYNSSQLTVELMLVTGSMFPPNFDSNELTSISWGTATLTFDDCNNATYAWQPEDSLTQYSSGQMTVQRLTQMVDLNCTE